MLVVVLMLAGANATADVGDARLDQRYFRDWEQTDTVLLATALTASALDWAQTRYIARHPDRFHEINPILGRHPSVGRVDAYFALCGLAAVGLTAVLSKTHRRWFLAGVTVVETAFVLHNDGIGIKARF